MALNYLKYEPRFYASWKKFLNGNFKSRKYDDSYLHWKYFSNYTKNKTHVYIALDNSRVVSSYSNLLCEFSFWDKKYPASVSLDIATQKGYRRKGHMSRLADLSYSEMKNLGRQFSVSYSSKQKVKIDQTSHSYGYKIIGKFCRYGRLCQLHRKNKYSFIETNNINLVLDPDFRQKKYTITNNIQYYQWRYIGHPQKKYKIFEVMFDAKFVGYIVTRTSKKILYIEKIIMNTEHQNDYKELIKSIETLGIKQRKLFLSFTVLQNEFWDKMLSGSFKYLKMANKYHLALKPHKDVYSIASGSPDLLNPDNWHIMIGDVV